MNRNQKSGNGFLPARALWIILPIALATAAQAQPNVKVLLWGGPATTSHNVPAFRDTITSYLTAQGMTVSYRQNTPYSWIHVDSLAQHDVLLVYTTNQNASDLSTSQIATLTNWLASGRVMVALHGTTNTFINGNTAVTNAWRALTGAQFLDHGPASGSGNSGRVVFHQPLHASLTGADTLPTSAANSGGQPYWDEGRRHNASMFANDTVMIARAHYTSPSVTSLPWIWVRPQGNGWVYYNASGHDHQVWTRPEFKGQVRRALVWGYEVKNGGSSLRGRAAVDRLLQGEAGMLRLPGGIPGAIEIFGIDGRMLLRGSAASEHDVSALPAGTYGVRVLPDEGKPFRARYIKER